MPARVDTPEARIASTTGSTFLGKAVGLGSLRFAAEAGRLARVRAVAEPGALGLASGEGGAGALADQPALLLGQRRIEVQHEGIGIDAELGDDEGHPLRHEPGDEGDVAGEAIELGDDDRALGYARGSKRCGELWPAIERIRAFAALDLDELLEEGDALGFGKAGDGGSLGFDAEAGAALPLGGDAVIGDGGVHQYRLELLHQTAYHRLPFGS